MMMEMVLSEEKAKENNINIDEWLLRFSFYCFVFIDSLFSQSFKKLVTDKILCINIFKYNQIDNLY